METQDVVVITPRDKLRLSDSFVQMYESLAPDWGPLGEITYRRTYAWEREDGTHEEWWETCRRVVEGTYTFQKWHCHRFNLPWDQRKAQRSAQIMYDLIFHMKFLPPGRGIQMMGTPHLYRKGSGSLFNCGWVTTKEIQDDFTEPFCWLMDFSMLGVGVGGDVRGAGQVTIVKPRTTEETYVVADTREGWVDLVRTLLNAYIGKGSLPTNIDYSLVRPKGARIGGFGGVASGPGDLIKLIKRLNVLLSAVADTKINSTTIVDIFNMIGACVVSGNIRRSAEIMVGSTEDEEFLKLKDPVLHAKELASHRWASNNSLFVDPSIDYRVFAEQTAKNGEPGYLWLDNARAYGRLKDPPLWTDSNVTGVNPCGEIALESYELCNLVEVFPSRHESYAELKRTLKYAYLYAKTITLVPTHNTRTNAVQMRNRRIGCSMTGVIDAFAKHGRNQLFNWFDEGYNYLRNELDVTYSDWLCVPRSKKMTTVKPSGSVSLLPGVTHGIHFSPAEYYYKTMRIAKTSSVLEPLRKAKYRIEDLIQDTENTAVVYFPVKQENFDRSIYDVSMWEQLENVAAMQYYWADNAVSATIQFSSEEAKDIAVALELYGPRLKSISFLAKDQDVYPQAPWQPIEAEEYYAYVSGLEEIDYSNVKHELNEKYCDGDHCATTG